MALANDLATFACSTWFVWESVIEHPPPRKKTAAPRGCRQVSQGRVNFNERANLTIGTDTLLFF